MATSGDPQSPRSKVPRRSSERASPGPATSSVYSLRIHGKAKKAYWQLTEPSMPFVISHQNRIHISVIDDIKREMPIVQNLIIFFLQAHDLAGKYLAIQATFVSDTLAKTIQQGAQPLRTSRPTLLQTLLPVGRQPPAITGMPFTNRPWSAPATWPTHLSSLLRSDRATQRCNGQSIGRGIQSEVACNIRRERKPYPPGRFELVDVRRLGIKF